MSDWMEQAACRGKTGMMFPYAGTKPKNQPVSPALLRAETEAKAICAGCPVRRQCAAAGRSEPYGIWAGKAERERNVVLSSRVGEIEICHCGNAFVVRHHAQRHCNPRCASNAASRRYQGFNGTGNSNPRQRESA